jgi:ATP-dependent Lon protease
LRQLTTHDNIRHIICQGQQRFRVLAYLQVHPFLVARIAHVQDASSKGDKEIEGRLIQLRLRAIESFQQLPQLPQEILTAVENIESASLLVDLVAGYLDINAAQRQSILEEIDLCKRLDLLLDLMRHRLEALQISREIDERTKTTLGLREREFLLREQMKVIQHELGDVGGGRASEIENLFQQLEESGMPPEVAKQAVAELRRLERTPEGSPEFSMIRTYLDWLLDLPWKNPEPDVIDIAQARKDLEDEHFGMQRVKERILELLAIRKLNPTARGPILCLVGPPGVGKTSLGRSIAKALGRRFVLLSLGGVQDDAEIRGHRRTYVGALPGNICQALKRAGTRGCVLMLDEIDKLGSGIRGDPGAAMLEVLDPEQNSSFRDHYLAVPYDLSHILFIATANVVDPIPGPLRDRMEVLQLAGYTQDEKREIAERFLINRQFKQAGLSTEQLEITSAALVTMIRDYTREAGVRGLERIIGAVCRKAAVRIVEGEVTAVRVDESNLVDMLGSAKFENEMALRTAISGVATGLAWTPAGGAILFVEASLTLGTGRLILTGQLGEIMKESAQAALTLVKSRSFLLGLDATTFEKVDVHVHVPAGAIPKDGPSAGVAMFVALASLFVNRPVRSEVAMVGEISLRGLVLPVSGIKEKVLAAADAGIKCVMLPARNLKDLEELPMEARHQLKFVFLTDVEEALEIAIE